MAQDVFSGLGIGAAALGDWRLHNLGVSFFLRAAMGVVVIQEGANG